MQMLLSQLKNSAIFMLPVAVIISSWIGISAIRLSWIISLALGVSIALKLRRLSSIRQFLKRNCALLIFSAIVCVYPLVSFLFGEASSFNVSLYISLMTGLVYMVYIVLLDDAEYDLFLSGAFFSCIVFGFWGCYEALTGNYFLFNNPLQTIRFNSLGNPYPGAAFANTNDLAQYLVMLFPISAMKCFKEQKIVFGIAAFMAFFAVLNTDSKLSMIAFAFVFAMVFGLKMLISVNINKKIKLWAVGAVAAIALIVIAMQTGLLASIFNSDSSTEYYTGRAVLYVNLLKTALTHPFGGFGTSYVIQEMPPHNLFLFILCDFGWIPAVLFAALLILLAIAFVKRIRSGNSSMFDYFLIAALCVFPIMSCVSSVNEQRKIIWLVLGVFFRFYTQYMSDLRGKNNYENSIRDGESV